MLATYVHDAKEDRLLTRTNSSARLPGWPVDAHQHSTTASTRSGAGLRHVHPRPCTRSASIGASVFLQICTCFWTR